MAFGPEATIGGNDARGENSQYFAAQDPEGNRPRNEGADAIVNFSRGPAPVDPGVALGNHAAMGRSLVILRDVVRLAMSDQVHRLNQHICADAAQGFG